MRYNIHGFSQENAVKLKLDNDCLLILRWFVDFAASRDMKHKFVDGKQYFWVSYEKISDDLPILKFKKDTLYRKLKSMASDETRVLSHITVKQGGTFSYYGFGDNYTSLIHSDRNPKGTDENPKGTDENPEGYGQKSVGVRIEIPNKDSSIKDYSISNNKDIVKKNKVKEKKDNKNTYSESVKLTDEQYEKLIKEFGEAETKDKIESLSLYVNSTGKKYKCHYSTILNWARKDKKNPKPVTKNFNNGPDNRTNYDERPVESEKDYEKYYYKVSK